MPMAVKKDLNSLKDQYKNLHEHMLDINDDLDRCMEELEYYSAFIEWKDLTDEFTYFREHAYEKCDENHPFPFLTL